MIKKVNFLNQYMSDSEARELLVEIGRRMYSQGYVVTNDGNMSVKISENELMVTPTGVSKGYMTPDMMVKITLDGEILEGTHKPSSEVKMHLRVYRENTEINGVVHAHPNAATSFAIAGIPLDLPIMIESAVQLGVVPVVKYAKPGSQEVPDGVAPFCRDYGGVLLSNHGSLTWGKTLLQAYYRLETLENYAKTTMNLMLLGKIRRLSKNQLGEVAKIKEAFGFTDGVLPIGAGEDENDTDVLRS